MGTQVGTAGWGAGQLSWAWLSVHPRDSTATGARLRYWLLEVREDGQGWQGDANSPPQPCRIMSQLPVSLLGAAFPGALLSCSPQPQQHCTPRHPSLPRCLREGSVKCQVTGAYRSFTPGNGWRLLPNTSLQIVHFLCISRIKLGKHQEYEQKQLNSWDLFTQTVKGECK